jgi:hypothetical protein
VRYEKVIEKMEEEEQKRLSGKMEVVPQEIERAKALEKDEAPRNDRTILSILANFEN